MVTSQFNLRVPLETRNEVFLMNTLTDAQLLVSPDVSALLDRAVAGTLPLAAETTADEREALDLLWDNGFLVPDRATTVYGAVQASNHAVMLGGLTSVSVAINEFVHESQKERGRTGVFVGSRGAKFRQELAGQRRSTDTRRAALATALDQISEAQR